MNGDDQAVSVGAPVAKVFTAWAAVGFTSWSDVAAFLAGVYSALLIGEWLWKKLARPYCERRGWVKRLRRRKEDLQE